MAEALKPGAPLVFTYHHNKAGSPTRHSRNQMPVDGKIFVVLSKTSRVRDHCAAGVALLDSGLVCSASLPCPAEMGGSIHIHGTASSIMDTVFVCRSSGTTPGRWLFDPSERLVEIVGEDLPPSVQ